MHDFPVFDIDVINTFPNLLHHEWNLRLLTFGFNSIGLSSDSSNNSQSMQQTSKTYSTMLEFISRALIGGVIYKEIYTDSEIDDKTNPPITTNNMGVDQNTNIHKIPTLPKTAKKVARLEKRKLDKKQYIAYKMIACTFLLGLVHDGNDPNTTLYSYLGHTMGCTATLSINGIVHRLTATATCSH